MAATPIKAELAEPSRRRCPPDHKRLKATRYKIIGMTESRVMVNTSRFLRWDTSWANTAFNSSALSRFMIELVTQTLPSLLQRPNAKALGMPISAMATLGIGILAERAKSSTIPQSSGYSDFFTYFTRMLHSIIFGPIIY